MTNIHLNPKKAKPSWLSYPCSICSKWTEDESPLDPTTKALLRTQKIPDGVRCLYHPILGDPDKRTQCPYKHLVGETIIGLYCDACGIEYKQLSPDDPELENMFKNPERFDLCLQCQLKKDKELKQHRHITVLRSKERLNNESE